MINIYLFIIFFFINYIFFHLHYVSWSRCFFIYGSWFS